MQAVVLVLVFTIVALFLLMQLAVAQRMKRREGRPAPNTTAITGEDAPRQLLLYFFQPHCRACRPMTPLVETLGEQRADVFQVDITQLPEVAKQFGVLVTPTTVLVRDGIVRNMRAGTLGQKQLHRLLGIDENG